MKPTFTSVVLASLWLAVGLLSVDAAEETAIAEPATAAARLNAIAKDPASAIAAGDDVIDLKRDVAAASDSAHGFAEGDWIPYPTCTCLIEKVGSDWRRAGAMLPTTVQDGPHYAINAPMDGPGKYRLTYHLEPPSSQGLSRDADEVTGVAPWWEPFSVAWSFAYPAE